MHNLQDFMISKTRAKIMELFFSQPDSLFYIREIQRLAKEEVNAVRRELERMAGYGLLKMEERGNRSYYFLNKNYTYFTELTQMVAKSQGLGKKIRQQLTKLGKIKYVMFSGKYIHSRRSHPDEVDMLVIGEVVLPELQLLIKEEQDRIGREINYTVFSLEEFEFRKSRRDPFIMEILYSSRVMVVGNDVEFARRQLPGLN